MLLILIVINLSSISRKSVNKIFNLNIIREFRSDRTTPKNKKEKRAARSGEKQSTNIVKTKSTGISKYDQLTLRTKYVELPVNRIEENKKKKKIIKKKIVGKEKKW